MYVYVYVYSYLFFALGYCGNCTGIKIDGRLRGNNEIVYKHLGDDLIIESDFPRVFGVHSFVPRLNGNSNEFPVNCECSYQPLNLTCNCSHLTTNNNGVYSIHAIVNTSLIRGTPEWCSNNVTIVIQSKAQNVQL